MTSKFFPPEIPSLSPEASQRLQSLQDALSDLSERFVGYPCSQDYDYPELAPFLRFSVNNVGDPFSDSIYRENTFQMECEVVDFFSRHVRASPDKTWGYMTSGGTEGNLYGLYLAREAFPDGIVYYSEHTHYSVAKLVRLLGVRNIMIRGLPNGEIDYEDLKATLQLHRDVPPIILANIGTTMHGAIDDLLRIKGLLKDLAITRSYIHCDAALSGMLLPWVDDPQPFGFDHGVDSLSVSGHKFIGSPMPCGVVIARQENVDRVARLIEYIGASDTTITGSRNALTPIVIWMAIQRWGEQGFRDRMRYGQQLADYTIDAFKKIGVTAWRHRNSLTVVFPRPSSAVIERWQIAPSEEIAHIITMPHVTTDMIDKLIADIAKENKDNE